MKLQGKIVLITGASKGIGRAAAEAFAKESANIIVNYNLDEAAANEVVAEAQKLGVKAIAVKADISNQNEVSAMFEEIRKTFSSLDVLVNNAGIFDENDGPDNLEAFQRMFAANFFGQVDVTSKARKLMNKGKIIFVSSIHAKLGNGRPSAIAYSSSKAALESYMKNLAKDTAPGILVNAVAPGRTLTPMWGEISEEEKSELASGHLINRWIEPSEIADGIVFLAKNDAVCGAVLVIDGGMGLKTLG
ncbi:SDR family oxidoreductase [Candidatus Saccharibacteria bacterium]|nr:SDR family oxidoreductase [Candidatus Saccharibacteria bacterium]